MVAWDLAAIYGARKWLINLMNRKTTVSDFAFSSGSGHLQKEREREREHSVWPDAS
jgi:hypothetical protein